MFSSPRSMKRSPSSIRMSPSWARLALATRSSVGSSFSIGCVSANVFNLHAANRASHTLRALDDLLLGQGGFLEPPQRELAQHPGQGVGACLRQRRLPRRPLDEPPGRGQVEATKGRIRLQGLPEEDSEQLRLRFHEVEKGRHARVRRRLRPGQAALQVGGCLTDELLEELALASEVLVEEGLRD